MRALLARINHDHNARYTIEDQARDPSSFDILVADGDLHVAGDLILLAECAFLLAVNGSLLVDGLYRDYDGPESYVLVSGDIVEGEDEDDDGNLLVGIDGEALMERVAAGTPLRTETAPR